MDAHCFVSVLGEHICHLPLHPSTHWASDLLCLTRDIQDLFSLCNVFDAFSIFHVHAMSSFKLLSDLPSTNSTNSHFPSAFWVLAKVGKMQFFLRPPSHYSIFVIICFCCIKATVHTAPLSYKNGEKNLRFCGFTLICLITKTQGKTSVFVCSHCSIFVKLIVAH